MARVPYQGSQEVAPELQAPNDYQHIDASPNDFGAQVGQGLEALGTGALDASKFYGEVAADDGFNNVQTQKQSIRYTWLASILPVVTYEPNVFKYKYTNHFFICFYGVLSV